MVDEKKFEQAGSLKPGNLVLIDGEVCQVKSVEKSKPGKHGAAKARIVAFNIFTGQKRGLLKGTDGEVEVPIVPKGEAQVVALMGEVIQIMDTTSYETLDAPKTPETPQLQSGDSIEYQKYGSNVKIVRKRWREKNSFSFSSPKKSVELGFAQTKQITLLKKIV